MNMKLESWFTENYEMSLSGRYISYADIAPLISSYKSLVKEVKRGLSVQKNAISLVRVGTGKKVVLAWSQMHGNESTTTKAIFDFLKFLTNAQIYQTEIAAFLKDYSFYFIPMLNPDGALKYTRENANQIDLNRDAKNLSQPESIFLRSCYEELQPHLCLNLHDQRSIFGLKGGYAAAISFLSPAANASCTITPSRATAIAYINKAIALLSTSIPNNIGRFDDAFNDHCVGDTFSVLKTPTILIEAGHIAQDYHRDVSRKYVFYSLLALLGIENYDHTKLASNNLYLELPENEKNFRDIVLLNVACDGGSQTNIYLHYKEVLINGTLQLKLFIDSVEPQTPYYAHKVFDLKGGSILLNSQQKWFYNQEITSIFDIKHNRMLI